MFQSLFLTALTENDVDMNDDIERVYRGKKNTVELEQR